MHRYNHLLIGNIAVMMQNSVTANNQDFIFLACSKGDVH